MKTAASVRVRFAPSPTGHLHIGGLRTAIFNWLFAKHNKGTFLLRLEDTDLARSTDEYTQSILSALQWADIHADEPMVIQSERLPEHVLVLEQLLAEKKAYRCYCTPEEIAARSKTAVADVEFAKYDGHCRSVVQIQNKPFVIRFALPDQKEITFNDLIRGEITFGIDQFDDFILARSDGRPVYNFVVVVDDAHMKISHVIRGEDHISNTPKQIMLHQACGFNVPQFAHLPLILGPSGQPLSKRDAATSVLDYKRNGYLPDALINYLVRLGWSHGDQELFTRQELINYFTLDHVGKKGAIFDMAKLGWVNSMYLKQATDVALLEQINQERPRFTLEMGSWSDEQILALISLYKERTKTIVELADELKSLHDKSTPFLVDDISEWVTHETAHRLKQIAQELENITDFSQSALTELVKKLAQQLNLKLVQLAQPLRIALLHKPAGPGVFELIAILGKKETLSRVQDFVKFIEQNSPLK